jgi:hypothetical protein
MMPTPLKDRDWKHEHSLDKKTGKTKAHLIREKARNLIDKKLGPAARKGNVVAHKKALSNGGTNDPSNLEVESFEKNAHFKRRSDHTLKE